MPAVPQLQPEIEMTKVTTYSSAHCPFCANASGLLQAKGVEQIEKSVSMPLPPHTTDDATHRAAYRSADFYR